MVRSFGSDSVPVGQWLATIHELVRRPVKVVVRFVAIPLRVLTAAQMRLFQFTPSVQLAIDQNAGKEGKGPERPEQRPMGAFFIWLVPSLSVRITLECFRLQENRDRLREQGFKGSDAAKEGGKEWRELSDKSEWENKAAYLKENYRKEMEAYKAGK
ncbi:FACT complex subunit Ssrp1-like protein [Aphelenchoides besseyi]|nr:FACT complex subunit Ssrp1-like protein [Aphelenchoides besseyi]